MTQFGKGLVKCYVHVLQHGMFAVVGENLTVRLRKVVFSRMLQQEIGWFDQPENNVGVLTARLSVDARGVRHCHRILPYELLNIYTYLRIVLVLHQLCEELDGRL